MTNQHISGTSAFLRGEKDLGPDFDPSIAITNHKIEDVVLPTRRYNWICTYHFIEARESLSIYSIFIYCLNNNKIHLVPKF
jgi:hypothetical protein